MSQQLINLSPDLHRLFEDGYEISIEHGHLIVRHIPYVTSRREIALGTLVSTLAMSGDRTNPPDTHVMMFGGEFPCDSNGAALEKIRHSSTRQIIGGDLIVDHSFSSKPLAGYKDYYEKVVTYASLLSNHAAVIDATVTARTKRVVEAADESSFVYIDNASGRAGISAASQKLRQASVAIVGLGGTGSYVLDQLAKTPIEAIHIYDGDIFQQHNAFRAPGAASIAELRSRPLKVDYLAAIYGNMHKGIVKHPCYIDAGNVDELASYSMAFLCVDANEDKPVIIDLLEKANVPFIDVGIGLELVDGKLVGSVRTTTSTPAMRHHIKARSRIPLHHIDGNDLYARNIQVADLNALNACLAVIRWKKLCGYYADAEQEHFSLFTIDSNHLLNEDFAA
ncbi:ThiF family adenylyltransferase [Mesorhizobium sp. B2-4-13]|uniref:ThiF family adenylyltransferase n=1 Tax=Mesorhizobium sp. B2-4-13 TaxID=2589936 RepID=UPI0011517F3F|nr:ThiF family adenylyltransferase [Mesorhizobium sp. B2-4-13]TPK85692.1 ThiF family adenylyltransferase [Mesorhizobium sp. B2-4-13]